MRKKIGIALGCGAALGIGHIGFFRALEEKNIEADIICGTSMGSIVGACVAAGVPLDDLERTAMRTKMFNIIDIDPLFYKMGGMIRGKKVENMLTSLIPCRDFSGLKIKFGCMAVNLVSGELCELTSGNLIDAIRASSAMPGAFVPIKIGEDYYTDGGVLERIPYNLTRKLGADVVIGVNVIGKPGKSYVMRSIITVLQRAFELTDHSIYSNNKHDHDLFLDISCEGLDPLTIKGLDRAIACAYNVTMENMDKILKLID